MTTAVEYVWLPSPVGRLLVAGTETGLCHILFGEGRREVQPLDGWREDDRWLREAIRQLAEYFAGTRQRFDLALTPEGTTFQRQVWKTLTTIPYGETIAYGELARRIGNSRASRAVGLANGANPLSIVVPCHRVIGSNGTLTGYGGGLHNKKWLLAHEREHLGAAARLF